MWVWISASQIQVTQYLIDTRYGNVDGYFSSSVAGPLWTSGLVYVNATLAPAAFESFPRDSWLLVDLQASSAFSDDLTLMSHVNGDDATNGHLKGKLSEVFTWSRSLSVAELEQLYTGSSFTITASSGLQCYYSMEEGAGDESRDITGTQLAAKLQNDPAWVYGDVPLQGAACRAAQLPRNSS
ncbi:hypothetical protein CYMTET_25427 [Cymbomonas tetramitiformis]|uniref:Uncharacterized protein n=1 Tax=Cymbomonas tetramitiformis TaxID=36881 RepID=A0AAE0FVD8_9CHLO|nr:hypothetical protein CYMTET_25427 [Cymbomonas tetramitiformis]